MASDLILKTTLDAEYVPGTNRNGDLASANWRFLLPSLRVDVILCLGMPPSAILAQLSKMARRVVVFSTNRTRLRRYLRRQQEAARLAGVVVDGPLSWPLKPGSVPLVVAAEAKGWGNLVGKEKFLGELVRLLAPDGVFYCEINGWIQRHMSRQVLRKASKNGLCCAQQFWLTGSKGEPRTIVPLHDSTLSRYFFERVIYGQSTQKRILSRLGELLSRTSLLGHVVRSEAVILKASSKEDFFGPPRYLLSLAAEAGYDLSGYRYAFSGRGEYNANKVIFHLFRGREEKASLVVKMTRAAHYNYRLENEYRVLKSLSEHQFTDPSAFPEPLFLGHHQGLAVLAQKAIDGVPFRTAMKGRRGSPAAARVIEHLTRLGAASADRALASSVEVADALGEVFLRYGAIFQPPKSERKSLEGYIERVARSRSPFPLVLQHGDPGAWNLMVREDSSVSLLDWEAGDPKGMPLWDLFYFMRSYGNWISRTEGQHDRLASFSRHFFRGGAPLCVQLVQATRQYCRAVGLESRLVESLFYLCWVHRALKESTRIPADSLDQAPYRRLLRLCLRDRGAPGLKSLFSIS